MIICLKHGRLQKEEGLQSVCIVGLPGYVDGPNSPVALYVLTSICERELGADEKNRSGRFSRETSDAFGL